MTKQYYCEKCDCLVGELPFDTEGCVKMAKHIIFCEEMSIERMRDTLWNLMSEHLHSHKWIFEENKKYYSKREEDAK